MPASSTPRCRVDRHTRITAWWRQPWSCSLGSPASADGKPHSGPYGLGARARVPQLPGRREVRAVGGGGGRGRRAARLRLVVLVNGVGRIGVVTCRLPAVPVMTHSGARAAVLVRRGRVMAEVAKLRVLFIAGFGPIVRDTPHASAGIPGPMMSPSRKRGSSSTSRMSRARARSSRRGAIECWSGTGKSPGARG